jgi:hypothetical protein
MPTVTQDVFRRKDKVVASTAMPGIPEGTLGRVTMVAGFDWVRYWVRFENGVVRGSLNRSNLARRSEWAEIQARRERGDDDDGPGGDAGPDAAADAPEAAGGDGYMRNGILVPQLLLDRSKKRREVLGV